MIPASGRQLGNTILDRIGGTPLKVLAESWGFEPGRTRPNHGSANLPLGPLGLIPSQLLCAGEKQDWITETKYPQSIPRKKAFGVTSPLGFLIN